MQAGEAVASMLDVVVDALKGGKSVGLPGLGTFSVAKTYLALLAGVAHDRGLLPDVNEPIGARVKGIGFDAGNNARVTWAQMLQQTSEWTGELFGLPDQADHYRAVTFGTPPNGKKGDPRPLQEPGTYWEYNDVRINQLSLALLHLFGLDHEKLTYRFQGRDFRLTDVGGKVVEKLFA